MGRKAACDLEGAAPSAPTSLPWGKSWDGTAAIPSFACFAPLARPPTPACARSGRRGLLTTGAQYIAWDPSTSQIRSWSFESDGGFGEGIWTAGNGTVSVQTKSTLADGKKLAATNVISRNGDGSISWQSTARTIDGKPLPDTEKVNLKRVR